MAISEHSTNLSTIIISPQPGPQPEQLFSDLRRWLELENVETDAASEESLAIAWRTATYQGDPTLGMAVKAVMLWAGYDATLGKLHRPPAATDAANEEDALLFGLVNDALRAIPELHSMVADRPSYASANFAATVALFATAAPETLAIPQAPTDVMVASGAAAAGITTEQFRAGYAAAIEAFKKGEAA